MKGVVSMRQMTGSNATLPYILAVMLLKIRERVNAASPPRIGGLRLRFPASKLVAKFANGGL